MNRIIECIPNFSVSEQQDPATYQALVDVANSVKNCVLFDAQTGYLIVGKGYRLVSASNKAGDAAHVADQMPAVVGQDHLDQDVTGEDLAIERF